MKRIGLLALAAVLALGLVGAGFAHWTETLTINDANADTGDLHMRFYGASTDDGPGRNDAKEYKYVSPSRWDVDVGMCQIEVTDEHTTKVTLSNVYPGYQARIKLGMRNTGSIPAEIESVTLTIIDDPDGVLDYVKAGGWLQVQWGPTSYHVYSLATGYPPKWGCLLEDFDGVLFSALKSTQTWPLQTDWKAFFASEDPEEDSLGFYILEGAPEDATLSFDLEMVWTQFNAT